TPHTLTTRHSHDTKTQNLVSPKKPNPTEHVQKSLHELTPVTVSDWVARTAPLYLNSNEYAPAAWKTTFVTRIESVRNSRGLELKLSGYGPEFQLTSPVSS